MIKSGITEEILENFRVHTLGGNSEIFTEIIKIYLYETPEFLKRMRESIPISNISEIQSISHNLKSNSATLGAMKMQDLAERIESLCSHNDIKPLIGLIAEATEEYKVVEPILHTIYKEHVVD